MAWTGLRLGGLIAAAVGVPCWIGSRIGCRRIPAGDCDGRELLGTVLATADLVARIALALPALWLGVLGRWLAAAAALALLLVALGSDPLWPRPAWLP